MNLSYFPFKLGMLVTTLRGTLTNQVVLKIFIEFRFLELNETVELFLDNSLRSFFHECFDFRLFPQFLREIDFFEQVYVHYC